MNLVTGKRMKRNVRFVRRTPSGQIPGKGVADAPPVRSRQAVIEIAFPQRDLHLRSVDQSVWDGFNRDTGKKAV